MDAEPVVLVGGFLSHWRHYLHFGGMLRKITGQRVFLTRIEPRHWIQSGITRPELLLAELDLAVEAACKETGADRLTIIGHSAGGLVARLYLSDYEWEGKKAYSGNRIAGRLITLGTPHNARNFMNRSIADLANSICPSCYYPHIEYYTVGSRLIEGKRDGTLKEQMAYWGYWTTGGRGDVWGDGLIPAEATRLDGARSLILDGVGHGPSRHRQNWYGSDEKTIRQWWTSRAD